MSSSSSREYRKISEKEARHNLGHLPKTNHNVVHTCATPKNGYGPRIHQEYEYFQLFDPDDSDIEEEVDPDVRSLLVSKITTYTTFSQSSPKKCCFSCWYIIHYFCSSKFIL